ncbi:MAG: TIR domain-containing protein, partial [Candidatus Binatia bacterium]
MATEESQPGEYAHHLFVSYSRDPDRPLAKRIESFIEGFHRTIPAGHAEAGDRQLTGAVNPLRVCLDGSDFVLPAPDAKGSVRSRNIDAVIYEHLAQCRELLVLCSKRATSSKYVSKEVDWFLENRGEAYVRVALTEGDDPLLEPEKYFPAALVERGFAKRACYDLRGFRRRESKTWNRVDEFDREMVRLAGDLLGTPGGRLFPTWRREQQLRRVKNRWAWSAVAATIVALILFGYTQHLNSEAQRLRADTEKERGDLKQREAQVAVREKQLAEDREQSEQSLRRAAQAFETLYRDPYRALHLADLSRSQRQLSEADRALESAYRSVVSRAENRRDYAALTGSGPGYLALRWRQGDVYSHVSPEGRHVLLVTKRAPDGSHTAHGRDMAGDVYLLDQETLRVRELNSCDPGDRRRVEYAGFDISGQRVLLTRQFHFYAYSLDGACQGKVNFSESTTSPIHLVGGYVLGRFVMGADSKGGIWYKEPDGKSGGTIRTEWPRERDPAIAFVIRPDGGAATIVFESRKAIEVVFEAAGKHREIPLLQTGVLCATYQPGAGGILALGDESGRVHFFRRGSKVKELTVASSAIEELGFVDEGQRLIAVSSDQTVGFVRVASGETESIKYSMGEYEKRVRRVPVPRVRHFRTLADQLGPPIAREAIQTTISKTADAGGRIFLFKQAENRLYPEVAYVSEGTKF